ncbi:MAG: rod shape-determining protein MreC [Candidatus Sulfotelmatobacter sp.]
MESVLGRYRNLTILVGVLFLQVLGLAVQVKRSGEAQNTRLIRIWAVDLITPFERGLVWVQTGSSDVWHNYFYLRRVRAENRELKQQIERMRLDQVRMSEDASQAQRLQSLLAFKEQFIARTVAAQVIGSCGNDLAQCIYLDKGKEDGIDRDMAVITANGIVGKVLEVFPTVSKVLMINDQSSGAGVYLEKSRLQGVLRGTPNGELIIERVMSDEQVSAGDTVLSSGGDQIFPKGLPVGTVTKVGPGREMFLSIKVKPAADLSRLEEVLVVTEKQERAPGVADIGTRARAADILALRLPSVPDKPPAAATAAAVASPGSASGSVPNVSPTAAKPAGTLPARSPNASSTPSSVTNSAVKAPVGETPKKEILKTAGQKVDSGNGANSGAKVNATSTSSAASKTPSNSPSNSPPSAPMIATPAATSTVPPRSANPSAKPATEPAQKPVSPPNSQPAATEDNPD